MRPAGFRAGAREAFAAEGLHADHRANHVAVDVSIADVGGIGQRLRARIDAGLQAQRQAVAEGIDLLDDRLRRFQRAAAPANDLQHRAENFVFDLADLADFKRVRWNAVCY